MAIGSDQFGFNLKEDMKDYIRELGFVIQDYGCHNIEPVDYPDVALNVSLAVKEGKADRGVLICGTGVGMAITANKVPGIRAAQCPDIVTAYRSRFNNDAQIMALGSWITGIDAARMLIKLFLTTEYGGGATLPKLAKIADIESRFGQ
ncbi:MAG: ribose 5-phosphate isomerase B [Firmicutes bacterium]|nr:ribose 5-phosphate isomerase B [Bacillota bacterium]